MKYDILLMFGPSGVGKSTLMKHVMQKYGDKFSFSISHTTRKPRAGEKDGVDYYYVTPEVINKMIEENGFIEHAHVHTNDYGTSKQEINRIRESGRIAILDIDVQGMMQIIENAKEFKTFILFIKAPSMEELEKRLRGRGTETEEEIQVRLNNARHEMTFEKYATQSFVNDVFESGFGKLDEIIESLF